MLQRYILYKYDLTLSAFLSIIRVFTFEHINVRAFTSAMSAVD